MTAEDEYSFYDNDENMQTTGRAVRRSGPALTSHVPIRFTPEVIAQVKELAIVDHMSVSSWIRRAVARELDRESRPRYVVHLSPPITTVTGSSNWPGLNG